MPNEPRAPVVGIVDQGREDRLRLYVAGVASAGARSEVLPWTGDPDRDATRFDAVVLCGGDDADSRLWGEERHPKSVLVPPVRDAYEAALLRAATAAGVPVLAVCRGAQMLNVALGGTLHQHVPDLPGSGSHGDGVRHEVVIEPGSLLGGIAGRARAVVNSFHHQAVGRLAAGLRVSARAADGLVEAVEGPGPFCLGVQWHPEREGNEAPLGQGLFDALVRAARPGESRKPGR